MYASLSLSLARVLGAWTESMGHGQIRILQINRDTLARLGLFKFAHSNLSQGFKVLFSLGVKEGKDAYRCVFGTC